MKFSKVFLALAAVTMIIAGCKKEEQAPSGDPSITLDVDELKLDSSAWNTTVSLTSNRDWEVKGTTPDWLTITPTSGKASESAQTINIAADANTGTERTADITFSTGSKTATLTVTQDGTQAKGDGSKENPFNVAEAIVKAQEIGQEAPSTEYYYIKGYITSISEVSTSYGNATFYIGDTQEATTGLLYCFQVKYIGGASFTSADQINVGDEVVMYAQIYNYKGNTPETSGKGASYIYTLNGQGGGEEPEPGDPQGEGTKDNPYNVAGAIVKAKEIGSAAASTEYYYFKGYITSIKEVSTSYGNATFYIGDSKGATSNLFYCFQVKNVGQTSFTSADQINVGDEVVMCGQIYNYMGNTPETSGKGASYIYTLNGQGGGGEEHKTITTEKVSDVIAAQVGDTVILNNALVVATAKTGYLVTDSQNKEYILVYQGTSSTDTPAAIGDKVNVNGVRGEYNSMPQLNTPATTVVSQGTQVTWPTPEDITATFDSFTSSTVKYVSYKGKLSVSGSYYNITVDGATKIGSILATTAADAYIGLAGVTFKGYYLYTSSNKYIYTIFTEAQMPSDYLTVNPATTNVAATAGTTEIEVSSDQSWTVASDNSAFTVNPASGSGNGTVTVTYSENTSDNARTANITFSVGGTVRATTVITQAKAGGDQYNKIDRIANLKAGTYYMAAFLEKNSKDVELKPYSYHCWTGAISKTSSNTDLATMSYSYEGNVLTINPSPSAKESGNAADIVIEAVSGETNTYYIKCGTQYLANGTAATNRRLVLQDTPAAWVATDHSAGGINFTNNGAIIGTASAESAFIRSYKEASASSLKYGLVFFEKQ